MIIEEILKNKKRRKVTGKRLSSLPLLSFSKALKKGKGLSFIAEIKISSPSEGELIVGKDPLWILKEYEENGADAISVITEPSFFKGDLSLLEKVKNSTSLPVLRKDFIIYPEEIEESWIKGADALLLIVKILDLSLLRDLLSLTREKGMEALVEVHEEKELEMALRAGAKIIGVNNRNLETMEVNLEVGLRLGRLIPPDCVKVCESGIKNLKDIKRIEECGFDAVLVGTSLLKSSSPGKKLRMLKGGRENES